MSAPFVKPVAEYGWAFFLVNTTGQVDDALGLAVLASLTSGRTAHLRQQRKSQSAALTAGYHPGFGISGSLVLVGVIGALCRR